jgi:hypothetical protein
MDENIEEWNGHLTTYFKLAHQIDVVYCRTLVWRKWWLRKTEVEILE